MHFKHNRPGNLTGNNVTGLWWSFLHKCQKEKAEQREKCWSSTLLLTVRFDNTCNTMDMKICFLSCWMAEECWPIWRGNRFADIHSLQVIETIISLFQMKSSAVLSVRQIFNDHPLHYRLDHNLHLSLPCTIKMRYLSWVREGSREQKGQGGPGRRGGLLGAGLAGMRGEPVSC